MFYCRASISDKKKINHRRVKCSKGTFPLTWSGHRGAERIFGSQCFHWGWTHEGVGRYPHQDGGGLFHRLGKLQANLQIRHIYWRPILLEVIVAGVRNTETEFKVVIGSHSVVIPTWKVALWRGWCTFQFSRRRGCLFSMSRVTRRWTRVTHA